MAKVVPADNLFDYFHDRVEEAREGRDVRLSDDTALYLASLLSERARADRPERPEQTLAELHARAAHAGPSERADTYRELGDRALYLLGCFQESLRRRVVSPSYYAQMGAAGYARADRVFRTWFADAFGPVFRELARHFDDCVEVLGEVSDRHREEHRDLMQLYQAWLRDGSPQLARRLREQGLLVPLSTADPHRA